MKVNQHQIRAAFEPYCTPAEIDAAIAELRKSPDCYEPDPTTQDGDPPPKEPPPGPPNP